jgi:hypothetical protein
LGCQFWLDLLLLLPPLVVLQLSQQELCCIHVKERISNVFMLHDPHHLYVAHGTPASNNQQPAFSATQLPLSKCGSCATGRAEPQHTAGVAYSSALQYLTQSEAVVSCIKRGPTTSPLACTTRKVRVPVRQVYR